MYLSWLLRSYSEIKEQAAETLRPNCDEAKMCSEGLGHILNFPLFVEGDFEMQKHRPTLAINCISVSLATLQ